MQQYIDTSPYHDALGSDTVSIQNPFRLYIDISNIMIIISMYCHQNVRILMHTTDVVVVHHGTALVIISEKNSLNHLIHT